MTIWCVGEVFLTRSSLVIDQRSFPDPVQRIVAQTDRKHFLSTKSERDLTDPPVSVELDGLVVVVLVVAVPQNGLVERQPTDAKVTEGFDLAGARVVVDVERLLSVGTSDGRDRRRRSSVSIVLVPEDCVVEIRRARAGEADFLFFGQSSVILVPGSHVEVVSASGHDGLEESGRFVVVELHLGLAGSDSAKASAGVVVTVRHLLIKINGCLI